MKTVWFTAFLLVLVGGQSFAQGYKLVWSDEFDSTALDQTKWSFETGNGSGGWGNNEWEYYTGRSQNCSVQNGYLTITAQKESYNGFNYTSARIKTQSKFSFLYGKVEARIKLPYGKGIWPAFWLLGDNISTVGWPACGENDIMEMIGGSGTGGTGTALSDATVYGTLHWSQNGSHAQAGGHYSLSSGKFADGFHTFGAIWTPSLIQFYVDGTVYYQVDITPAALSAFKNKFFIILNLAVGGNWPGYPDNTTVFPQTMQVDYVRVYQDTTMFPTVSLASPQNQSTLSPYSDINIVANASMAGASISKVEFYQDADKIGETFVSPYQMTWRNVFPGNYRLTAVAYSNTGFSTVSDTVNVMAGNGGVTSPYGGTPSEVPGTIEAENFDMGGQGIAYYDTDPQNTGGSYRPDEGVDIEACSDTGGGYDVGWTAAGEWLLYTIDVTDSGDYQIGARVASAVSGGALSFTVDGKAVTGVMNVPNTGGWQNWVTLQSDSFALSTGPHQLKLLISSGQFNINKFYIYPPGAVPSIELLYPEGGESFAPDSIVEIKWRSPFLEQVRVGLSVNGGGYYSLVQSGVDARFGVYRWKVPAVDSPYCKILVMSQTNTALKDTSGSTFSIGTINSVVRQTMIPCGFELRQNFPNPFNPATRITYQIPESTFVTMTVYDMLGREVGMLVKSNEQAGEHGVTFNGADLPSGIYVCVLKAGSYRETRKMVLMK